MGLLDLGAKILLTVKADTSDAKASLKSLAGEERKLAQERLAQTEAHNKNLEDQIKRIGKVTAIVGTAGAAIAIGAAGFKQFERESRLMSAAAGADIDKLSAAAGGLATRMELLEFAAKSQHGAFKLSNEQMATAQKAILAITRAGYDHAEVTNKVTEALVKANGGALDDFGILVKSGASEVENFNILMEALAKKAGEADGSTAGAGESVAKAGVEFTNAFDSIKSSIGEMVVAMGPLIEGAAKLAGVAASLVGKIAEGYSDIAGLGSFIAGGGKDFLGKYGLTRDKKTGELYVSDGLQMYLNEGGSVFDYVRGHAANNVRNEGAQALIGGLQQFGRDALGSAQGIGGTIGGTIGGIRQGRSGRGGGRKAAPKADEGRGISYGTIGGPDLGWTDSLDWDDVRGREEAANAAVERTQALTDSWYQKLDFTGPSLLDRLIGDVTTISAQDAALQGLTGTWDAFASGVTAAYNAMVDGSGSWLDAAKAAVAGSLKAQGAEMAVGAIKETGLGFASLAIGGPLGGASAASHFKAAAVLAGGAVLAGVAAAGLGSSGGSTGSASAAAGTRSYATQGGSSSSAPQEPTRIIVYADAFAEDSERGKRIQAERIVKRALGSGAVQNA